MSSETRSVGGLLGLFIILILTISITYDIVKKAVKRIMNETNSSSNTSKDTISKDIHFMIYIGLFAILLHAILTTFNFVFSSNNIECKSIAKSCTFLFHLSRSILSLIFVRRVQFIYNDTMFALNKLHSYIMYIFIAIYSIPFIVYFNWYSIKTEYDVQFGCLIQYESLIFLYIVSILHIFIAIYCLYLFIYPLYRLLEAQEDKQISRRIYNVLVKYSILYSSSIFSTFILIAISYLLPFGYNYSIIDGCINGIILILLHPIHNVIYKPLCCLLHSLCIIICHPLKHDKQTDKSKPVEIITKTKETQTTKTSRNGNSTYTETPTLETSKLEITALQIPTIAIPKMQCLKRAELRGTPSASSNTSTTTVNIRDILKDRVQRKFHQETMMKKKVDVILENENENENENESQIDYEKEMDLTLDTRNTMSLKLEMTATSSFKSISSLHSVELDDKMSNTLQFINYESIQL